MDPRALALPGRSLSPKRDRAPRHKSGERFLRGPIPMDWLCAASAASGQGGGLKVAIALWYLSGLNRQAKTVKLSGAVLRALGVQRHAAYRGLEVLERAGLVSVERRQGQSPIVTLLGVGGRWNSGWPALPALRASTPTAAARRPLLSGHGPEPLQHGGPAPLDTNPNRRAGHRFRPT